LPFEFHLLPLDPTELSDDRQPHRIVADPQRGGDTNATSGGIYPQMQVLDVLANDLNL
jgi:hypothetical protein